MSTRVQKQEGWGCWVVDHNYYGLVDESVTRWVFERISPNTEAAARELAARADEITALVEQQAAATQGSADAALDTIRRTGNEAQRFAAEMVLPFSFQKTSSAGKPDARLTATQIDGRWKISEYDFSAWTAVLP